MESPTPAVSRIRAFMAESSSSGCKEVDELELSSPINRNCKPKTSKQKEAFCHEIIDVDMDEDSDFELTLIDDPEIDTTAKGKEVLSNSSGDFDSLAYDESGNDGSGLLDSANVDDFSSVYNGEDEWVDTYYDDILYDDSAALESHFDHMDIPPGVEMSFPWLLSPKKDTQVIPASTSTPSSTKIQSDKINHSPGLNSSDPWSNNSVTDIEMNAGNQFTNGKLPSIWTEPGLLKKLPFSSSTGNPSSLSSKSPLLHQTSSMGPFHFSGKSSKKKYLPPDAPDSSHYGQLPYVPDSSHYGQLPYVPLYPGTVNVGGGGSAFPSMPKGIGLGSYMPPVWQDFPMNAFEPSLSPSGLMNNSPFTGLDPSPVVTASQPAKVQKNLDEVLLNFANFKKFDTVEDSSDHHYSKNGSSAKQPPKNWAKRIQDEWKILEKDLPGEIFVRVYESRMDLLRAVIIGAEGTPYHDGLFFFDVFFPSTYPSVPPHVHYHSRGLRINPNLYNCGKVCLSLLNTWGGSQKEKWIPGTSTMLQVLVSIQGLILNAKPYFNEPGYANMAGTVAGEMRSLEYNERTFIYNLQTMVYNVRRPPMHFEDFAVGYFCKHARGILVSCRAYLDGAQVGCLVKGGVQDVDEGDKSCSHEFKSSLGLFMTTVINQFVQIGAKDCEEFLYLGQLEKDKRANAAVQAVPPPPGKRKFIIEK